MIDIGAHHYIRADQVKEMLWDRRFYANGSESWLVIKMMDGSECRVEQPRALQVERAILAELGRHG